MAIGNKYTIKIYDLLGQLMYAESFAEKKKEINNNLPKGIYQLQVEMDFGRANSKVLIQ